jgi:hypothetical protein
MELPYKPPGDCVFIHIPKTAGLSIYESVLELERPFDWFSGLDKEELDLIIKNFQGMLKNPRSLKDVDKDPATAIKYIKKDLRSFQDMAKHSRIRSWSRQGASMLGHIHYGELIKSGKLDKDYFDGAFKFAFVRNPYDRLVSLYNYHQVQKRLGIVFDHFVEILYREFQDETVPPVGLYNVKNFGHRSQLFHISIYGNQYNPMVDWLPKDQHVLICYLETFEEDVDKLLSMMGFSGKREAVPKKNKARKDVDYMDYYKDRRTIDLVNKIYKADFDAFGYDML